MTSAPRKAALFLIVIGAIFLLLVWTLGHATPSSEDDFRKAAMQAAAESGVDPALLGAIVLNENQGRWPTDMTEVLPIGSVGPYRIIPASCPNSELTDIKSATLCASSLLKNYGFAGGLTPGDSTAPKSKTLAGAFSVYCGGPNYLARLESGELKHPYRECTTKVEDGLSYFAELKADPTWNSSS